MDGNYAIIMKYLEYHNRQWCYICLTNIIGGYIHGYDQAILIILNIRK